VPREVRRLVLRCLEKNAALRFASATELREELERLASLLDAGKLRPAAWTAPSRWAARRPAVGTAAALVVTSAWWLSTRTSRRVQAPLFEKLTFDDGLTFEPALSADGRWLVYSSDREGDGGSTSGCGPSTAVYRGG